MTERKRCVILGATGGIGQALAQSLSAHGWDLILVGRNQDKLNDMAGGFDPATVSVSAIDPCDISLVDKCVSVFGKVHAIVNCVGSVLLKPAHRTSPQEWADVIHTNLNSSFAAVSSGAKYLETGGAVILFSSAAAGIGLPNHEAIAAAKAGVEGLSRSAAASYAAKGLRFNCIAPGLVKTPMTAFITGNEASLKASEQMHALGRVGEPEDIVSAVNWLLSDQATWITGQTIGVDGGLSTLKPPMRTRA